MMKKVLAVILVLTVVVPLAMFGVLRTDVSAEDKTYWEYIEDTHTLRLYGEGKIPNYSTKEDAPWYKEYSDKITTVVIENGVTEIGNRAFAYSSVKFVDISNTVTRIGKYAFTNCKSLVSVSIPDSVKQIEDSAFSSCENMIALDLGNGVETINQYAFSSSKNLASVTIPSSVKTIGYNAFGVAYGGKLVVTFSEGLEVIGESAFYGIQNTKVTIPDSVRIIGKKAFENCRNLTEVVTGENLTEIGQEAFKGDSKYGLTSIDLSRSQKLTTIGSSAFYRTKITQVDIPDSVETIGGSAFYQCSQLEKVKLPNNNTTIGGNAFTGTAIASIEIPEGVKVIGDYAFSGNKNLTKVAIPHSVDQLGTDAFYDCTSLAAVDITGINLEINERVFDRCPITHVHIPSMLPVAYFAGKSSLPADESYYFQIGADGKCPAAVCPFRESAVTGILGDVNHDGTLNNADIILLGRAYMSGDAKKNFANYAIGDINNDKEITNADIILLGRLYMAK